MADDQRQRPVNPEQNAAQVEANLQAMLAAGQERARDTTLPMDERAEGAFRALHAQEDLEADLPGLAEFFNDPNAPNSIIGNTDGSITESFGGPAWGEFYNEDGSPKEMTEPDDLPD